MSSPIVALRDVRRDYALGAERVHALQGVTLDVERGDYVAIVGPSGCGKSTLLNMIGVIDQPTSGTVEIGGQRVDAMSDREARLRQKFGVRSGKRRRRSCWHTSGSPTARGIVRPSYREVSSNA